MTKIKKALYVIIGLTISLSITSCLKYDLSVYYVDNVATVSETENKIIDYGDKLKKLEGDVFTLSKYNLPKEGDKLYGFNVEAIYDYEYKNAKLVLFTHEKTGARVMLISNDDEDKAAVLGFNTLTYDNKGIPHVFEHACLGGSKKYPNANLFEEASNKTYNTFMNAFTMQNATVYPFSSLSDEQLFELYKFYIDGVMDPEILRNENNLKREAYRYILNNKDDDIDLSGIVYSEMSGVEGDIVNTAFRNSLDTMYEGSYMGVNTGGKTSDIIDIKHEDLIAFHKKYYHPSNMVITLYGDIDYKKYLSFTDEEYLSKYEKENIDKNDLNYVRQDDFKVKKYDFPVSENDDTEGQTIITYNVVCEDMSAYENGIFTVVMNALSRSDGLIQTKLKDRLPNARFELENGLDFVKPFFSFYFFNVDENDQDVIKEVVEESFAEIIDNGIDEDVVNEIVDNIEMNKEIIKDSHGFMNNIANFYLRVFGSNGEELLGNLRYIKGLEDIKIAYDKGDIKKLIDTYLSDNKYSSMTITLPKKGLLEENAKKKSELLKSMKDSLIDEEINSLIEENKEHDKWEEEQTSKSYIDMLRVASVSSLDEYRAKCYAYEENSEGIRFIRSDIENTKLSYVSLLFDTSEVKYEDTLKIELLTSLLVELPTTNYDGKKLKANIERYAPQYSISSHINHYYEGGYKPYFAITIRCLDKNIDKVFELLEELMYETRFDDIKEVRNIVSNVYNNKRLAMLSNPSDFAQNLVLSQNDTDYLYDNHINGVDYIKYLKEVSEMSDEELKGLLPECRELLMSLYNRAGCICEIISNFNMVRDIKSKVIDLSYGFRNEKIKVEDYSESLEEIKNKLAILSNGTMQYNYISMPLLKNDIEYSAKFSVLANILNDKILYPEFRVKRSAYGSYINLNRLCAYIYTYRDPNIKETYDTYKEIPKMIKNIKISNEELEDYKINAYAKFSYPLSKFNAAKIAIDETMEEVKEKRANRYVRYMKEIKELTSKDLDKLYTLVDKLIEEDRCLTIGGREKVEGNKDFFDMIIYDYVQ